MINMHERAVEDFTVVIRRNLKNAHAHFRRAFSLKALKVSQRRRRTVRCCNLNFLAAVNHLEFRGMRRRRTTSNEPRI